MSNYVVTDTQLEDVADAIRAKSGGSSPLAFPAGFVSEIGSIQTGGGGGMSWEMIADYTSDADAQVVVATIPEGKQNANIYRVHYKSAVGEYYPRPRINGTGGGYLANGTWALDFDLYIAKVPNSKNQSEVSGLSNPTYYCLASHDTNGNNVSAGPLTNVGISGYDANRPIHAGMNIKVWRLVEP